MRETLPIARRSRSTSRLTIGLLVSVGIAAGFLVGVKLQKDQGAAPASAASPFAAFAGSGANGAGRGVGTGGITGAGGGTGGFGGATIGTVKLVDGSNVYITDAQGTVVKVSTTGSTISKSAPGTVADFQTGETLIVRGTTATDGTVTATSITDSGVAGTPSGG